jgi:NAD-dependent dihydropyrimidine dehydrogenase PreA subunit
LSTPFGSKPAENFKAKRLKTKTIETSANYSRREFFSLLTGKATERIVEHNSQDGIPEKRAILIEALKILAEREDLSSRHIKDGAFPIHQVEAGERCTLCHSCELFCPTGALKRIEEDGELRIDFQISLCVRCYQCEELCPQGALYYRDSIDLMPLLNNKIRTLRKLSQKDCPQCGRPYFSKKVLDECPRCRKKKDLDSRIIAILTGDSDGESLRIRRKGKGVKSVGSVT